MASDWLNVKGCPEHPESQLQIYKRDPRYLYCAAKDEFGIYCTFRVLVSSLKPKERARVERKLNEDRSH